MTVVPPDELPSALQSDSAAHYRPDPLVARWQSIHLGAARLAQLAGLRDADIRAFSAQGRHDILPEAALDSAFATTVGWQRDLVGQALEDIEAMMHSGMTALDVLVMRGRDVAVPALALWREVDASRRSVMAMLAAIGRIEGSPAV